jgi:hypothetical protein
MILHSNTIRNPADLVVDDIDDGTLFNDVDFALLNAAADEQNANAYVGEW